MRYEYKAATYLTALTRDITHWLNTLSADGWELDRCGTAGDRSDTYVLLIMRRPVVVHDTTQTANTERLRAFLTQWTSRVEEAIELRSINYPDEDPAQDLASALATLFTDLSTGLRSLPYLPDGKLT